MKQKKSPILLMTLILAAVIIIVLVILLILSNSRKAATEPGASASPSGQVSASASSAESGQPSDSFAVTGSADAETGQEKLVGSLIRTDVPVLTEEQKLELIDFDSRVFRPVYQPAVSLSAQGGLGADAQTAAPWSCVVTPDDDQTKTFALSLDQSSAAQASKIIWQVSLVPFDGGPAAASGKPGGLLLSGESAAGATSFTVDFSKVYTSDYKLHHPAAAGTKAGTLPSFNSQLKPDIQLPDIAFQLLSAPVSESVPLRTYYVRAFPVDSAGNSIGDGGTGLPVLYGDPLPIPKKSGMYLTIPALIKNFTLMPARGAGTVSYDGEFPNNFFDAAEVTLYNTSAKSYSVLPGGIPDSTEQLVIQVCLSDFSGEAASDWTTVPGLVYELKLSAGDPAFAGLSGFKSPGLAIDFSKFVPADSALPEKEYIPYYVRAVALTAGTQPGTAGASYSETVIINYGKYQADDFKFLPQVKIEPKIPVIEKLTYTPVQWEATNWQYHYVVTRQPTTKEVFMGLIGGDEPYAAMPVGTRLDLTPQPENKSWWEEAWDAISDFFSDIGSFFAKLVNWVSNAYNNLKTGLINIVVSALPSDLQGPLRTALTAMVDYGLASMGIPPTLPNFDDLASMGTDYLASVAMQQAGIPADSLLEYGAEELADKIGSSLAESAKGGSPNPMDWDFVQLDPDDLYRPAYLTLELYNPYDTPTPAGKLSFTADKFMDLTKNGSDQSITYLYGKYGSSYVCLYKPVFGMEIPSLYPGQRLTVPVILEEYVGIPFPGCPAPVDSGSYKMLYRNLGAFDFSLYIAYDLPPIGEEAKNQGHTEDAIYSYSTLGNSALFTIAPYEGYGN
jgi:hypothetical protein